MMNLEAYRVLYRGILNNTPPCTVRPIHLYRTPLYGMYTFKGKQIVTRGKYESRRA